jgi:DNA repair exonuclease SbcCD ATPase subunit
LAAEQEKRVADAQKAKVQAQYAEKVELAGLEKTGWDVKNLKSQINNRAAQLKLDAQRTQAEVADKLSSIQSRLTSLPESAQKLVNESAVNASTAQQASSQYTEMAKQLDGLGNSWGALNNLGEWSKSQFGNQDFRTAIQNEYTRLANSAGIKAYKAAGATGGFSDADLNTALAGIPKANANPQIMAQFMRGMAKEQAIAAALDNAKTDWLSQNKGQLGRASGTFLAGDYAVKPGETYADFTARVTKDVVKKFTTPAQSSMVQQIPTDANPRPMAATSSIEAQADAIIRGGR